MTVRQFGNVHTNINERNHESAAYTLNFFAGRIGINTPENYIATCNQTTFLLPFFGNSAYLSVRVDALNESSRNHGFRCCARDVLLRCSHQTIQIRFFYVIGIEENKVADTQMRELLRNV